MAWCRQALVAAVLVVALLPSVTVSDTVTSALGKDAGIHAAREFSSTLSGVANDMPASLRPMLRDVISALDGMVQSAVQGAGPASAETINGVNDAAQAMITALKSKHTWPSQRVHGLVHSLHASLSSLLKKINANTSTHDVLHVEKLADVLLDASDSTWHEHRAFISSAAHARQGVLLIIMGGVAMIFTCLALCVAASCGQPRTSSSRSAPESENGKPRWRVWRLQGSMILASLIPLLAYTFLLITGEATRGACATLIAVGAACVAFTSGHARVSAGIVVMACAIAASFASDLCSANMLVWEPSTSVMCRQKVGDSCPHAYQLLRYNEAAKQYHPVEESFNVLRKLPAPLHVFSELGPMNTGKSLRQTMVSLLFSQARSECSQFGVRKWGAGHTGETKGIWFAAFPVDGINRVGLPYKLQAALQDMEGATIILVDTEGADEPGQVLADLRRLQIITLGMSTAVSISTRSHVGTNDLRDLAYFGHLLAIVDRKLAGLAQCNLDFKFATTSSPASSITISRPRLFVLPKNTQTLLHTLDGVWVDAKSHELHVAPNATLDATTEFWSAVNKSQDDPASVATIKATYGSAAYLVNLPPRQGISARLGWACPADELASLAHNPPSLPRCWRCGNECGGGVVFGYAHHILPRIMQSSSKVIYNKEANGEMMADFILELHSMTLGEFDFIWSEKNVDAMAAKLCKHVSEKVEAFLLSLTASEEEFPIEHRVTPGDEVACDVLHPKYDSYCKCLCGVCSSIGLLEVARCDVNHGSFVSN